MVPNLIALTIPFFFMPIGVELALARPKRPTLREALSDLGSGVAQPTGVLPYSSLLFAAYARLYALAGRITLPVWAQWAVALISVAFVDCGRHRLWHPVNVQWAARVVHYQRADYNLAVAVRQSMTTTATLFPFYALLVLAGVGTAGLGPTRVVR